MDDEEQNEILYDDDIIPTVLTRLDDLVVGKE